jgi:hypothetical protein
MEASFTIFYSIFAIFITFLGTFIGISVFKKLKVFFLKESLDMVLFLVKMVKYEEEEEKRKQDPKALIGQVEQFFSSFLTLKRNFFFVGERIALEIASEAGKEEISFYVAVPRSFERNFEKFIHGVYPTAQVEKVPQDYTIFHPKSQVSASYLKLKEYPIISLFTYRNLDQDPILPIATALTKIKENEGAAIQIILRPTKFKIEKKASKFIAKVTAEGKGLREALVEVKRPFVIQGILRVINFFIEGIMKLPSHPTKPEETVSSEHTKMPQRKVDEHVLEAVRSKIKKQCFDANIRLVASADTKERAEEILAGIEKSFGQFSSPYNHFVIKRVKGKRLEKLIYDYAFRNFNEGEKIILNLEEIASIYHFPLPGIEVPGLKWERTKESPPPAELPKTGEIMIGEAVYRGEKIPIYFASREDRRRHFYIIGQTGTGKTSLLREMIRQDIENGEGVGVIDPHGDLIEYTLANIPRERFEDVVLFEPFDMDHPMGLNMLEWDTPEQKDFAVSEMIAIFHKLFPPEIIGPMFEHYMRNAMLAVMADHQGTLVDIPRIFTDEEFMYWKLEKVTDPLVRNFWLREWKQTIGQTRSDMLGYVVSKVGRFVENTMMRNIIGQAKSSFDLSEIMDTRKIFLANLSKGLVGELNSSLLGLILVSKMQIAAMARASISEEERIDFYLYIDEFQNFTTDSIVTILSEARKYRLNLILAHQYIPQLPDPIKHAVIGNVGTLAALRIGAQDAEFVEKIFEPEFSKYDLLNLDNFTFVIRLMVNGKITIPFKGRTIKPKTGNWDQIQIIKMLSKSKYARPREVVEKEIMERSRLAEL